MKRCIISLFLFTISFTKIYAQKCFINELQDLNKISSSTHWTKFNINNISTFIYNNGNADISPDGNSGFEYPKGSNKTTVFESGIIWGGKIDEKIYVGGSDYAQGLFGGKILENGNTQNSDDPSVRVYRVRPDYKTSDLSAEIEDEKLSYEEIFSQYEKDWNEWPAEFGAPFEDKNNNGIYESTIDIPGIPYADQTLWYVANDFDTSKSRSLYGSDPMKIELQVTIWGYKNSGFYDNVMFKKYKIINKSDKDFKEMYFSQWSDQDLGYAGDDYIGVDTTLNLMYAFNGDIYDDEYISYDYFKKNYQLQPPAVGFQFLQGPIVKSENNTAIYNDKEITGSKNLDITSFYFYLCAVSPWSDPPMGDYDEGVIGKYNNLRGLHSGGFPIIIPEELGGGITTFPRSGDPITGEGWTIGTDSYNCGDVRGLLSCGPFEIVSGDTQEVVIAQTAILGKDRMNAFKLLKFYSSQTKEDYLNFVKVKSEISVPQPNVSFSEYGEYNSINIEIEKNPNIESFCQSDYSFQGYNLYQIYSEIPTKDNSIKIATFDKIDEIKNISGIVMNQNNGLPIEGNIQEANDSGLKYEFKVDKDFTNNSKLLKGKKYYYGLSAYFVNSEYKIIESLLNKIYMEFQLDLPGNNYFDTLVVSRNNDIHSGFVIPIVINPEMLTGDEYKVTLTEIGDSIVWNLIDITKNQILLTQQKLLNRKPSNPYEADYTPIVDGFILFVGTEPLSFAGNGDGIVEIKYNGNVLTEEKYDLQGKLYNGNKVWHSLNSTQDYYISAGGGSGNLGRLIWYRNYAASRDFELRFTETGGFGIYPFIDNKICKVPFELWDIGIQTLDDPSDDIRMIPFLSENDSTKSIWGWATGIDPFMGYPNSDWINWMDPKDSTPGTKGYDQFANSCILSGGAGATYDYQYDIDPIADDYNVNFHDGNGYPIARMTICDYSGKGIPPAGTTIRLNTTKPLTTNDIFTFKSEITSIKINPNIYKIFQNYPNPFNPSTKIRYSIPEEGLVNISVYNILGQNVVELVNKRMKPGKYETIFNGSNFASGVYIYRIEAKNFFESKKMILLK